MRLMGRSWFAHQGTFPKQAFDEVRSQLVGINDHFHA